MAKLFVLASTLSRRVLIFCLPVASRRSTPRARWSSSASDIVSQSEMAGPGAGSGNAGMVAPLIQPWAGGSLVDRHDVCCYLLRVLDVATPCGAEVRPWREPGIGTTCLFPASKGPAPATLSVAPWVWFTSAVPASAVLLSLSLRCLVPWGRFRPRPPAH